MLSLLIDLGGWGRLGICGFIWGLCELFGQRLDLVSVCNSGLWQTLNPEPYAQKDNVNPQPSNPERCMPKPHAIVTSKTEVGIITKGIP